MPEEKTALDILTPYHSWTLSRISNKTLPQDVVVTTKATQVFTDEEAAALSRLMKTGNCYRCRIGKGRFYFGETALQAAELAVAAEAK